MRRLAEVKGLSEQKIQKFKDIIKSNELVQMGFQTAATRLGAMNEMIKISTGQQYNLLHKFCLYAKKRAEMIMIIIIIAIMMC